jgi:hypothetical protein
MNTLADISPAVIDELSLRILDYYEDGKYAFDESLNAQTQNHRTQKSYIKKSLIQLFKHPAHKPAVKYIEAIMSAWVEGNPSAMRILKQTIRNQTKQIEDLQNKMEGKCKIGMCQNCFHLRDEIREQVKLENGESKLHEENERNKERVKNERKQNDKLRVILKEKDRQLDELRKMHHEELSVIRDNYAEEISKKQEGSKENPKYKRKYKSLQKEFEAYKKKHPEYTDDITSSSSDED